MINRRAFLATTGLVAGGFLGLRQATARGLLRSEAGTEGYGELVPDPDGLLNLPRGFSYTVVASWGDPMDDGLLVPAKQDGMAAFAGSDGNTILICNHENSIDSPNNYGAFGGDLELLPKVDSSLIFDAGKAGKPCLGGTTTLVYDTAGKTLVRSFMSLCGTGRNCAGGPTPWGSWLTCEEWVQRENDHCALDHGWVFEVPATSDITMHPPKAIKAMGRFYHEAVAVCPRSGCVYLTEDRNDGVLYRFIPNDRRQLDKGGKLQALVVRGRPGFDLRNWKTIENTTPPVSPGTRLEVDWIDLTDIDSPDDDLRYRANAAGAAIFARGEGMWAGHDSIFFVCTTGGAALKGQIWRYHPSRLEGSPGEQDAPAHLELFIESEDDGVIRNADNLTITPNGDLFVSEDCVLPIGSNGIVRVTIDGRIERFALHPSTKSELAGVCASPDGSTLFVNIQDVGKTLAITGPWRAPGDT